MVDHEPNKLNKRNGTYQVTFRGKELEQLRFLLDVNGGEGRGLPVSQLVRDLLNVAVHQYFADKDAFIKTYGILFYKKYFLKLDQLRNSK